MDGCYVNNVFLTWNQLKLFEMYKQYIEGNLTKEKFKNAWGNYEDFEIAERIYNNIIC